MTHATQQLLNEIAEYGVPSATGNRALPPRAYVDPVLFELERRAIFQRAWICVGRVSDFTAPGDYLALPVAGEPVLVIRGNDGVLRALSNVCRHRSYPLAPAGRGNLSRLLCGYHHWNYRLDGTLAGAPCMADVPDFEASTCRLPEFASCDWLGFVFVNLDPAAAPLVPKLVGVETIFARHDIAASVTVAEYRKVWAGNWKLAVENGSESYHHMGLHSESLEPYMPARGSRPGERTPAWASHYTPILAERARAYGVRLDYPTRLIDEDRAAMKVVTIFPNFLLLSVGDLINWISWIPVDVGHADVLAGLLLPAAALPPETEHAAMRAGLTDALHAINTEDERATELLQPAAASMHAGRGHLSPLEGALVGFYEYLAHMLAQASV